MDKKELANVILDMADYGKRLVHTPDAKGDVQELRMQLRELAFALIRGEDVRASDLF